jgi:hypothetical protein
MIAPFRHCTQKTAGQQEKPAPCFGIRAHFLRRSVLRRKKPSYPGLREGKLRLPHSGPACGVAKPLLSLALLKNGLHAIF